MEDKSLELLTEEERQFLDEFTRCQSIAEIDELAKRREEYKKARGNTEIPHYNMTLEEFDKKYQLASFEDIKRKMGWNGEE